MDNTASDLEMLNEDPNIKRLKTMCTPDSPMSVDFHDPEMENDDPSIKRLKTMCDSDSPMTVEAHDNDTKIGEVIDANGHISASETFIPNSDNHKDSDNNATNLEVNTESQVNVVTLANGTEPCDDVRINNAELQDMVNNSDNVHCSLDGGSGSLDGVEKVVKYPDEPMVSPTDVKVDCVPIDSTEKVNKPSDEPMTPYLELEGTSTNTEVDECSKDSIPLPKVEASSVERCNYHLKWFEWRGEQTPIVTQNENGPCPLLAIANVLILARKINLPQMQQLISGKQLMEYIGDCILMEAPKQQGNEELILNYEQNMQDAIDIMHKLQTGIDVNVKFTSVTDFEFTSECIVFDLLKIQLYHGWLIDPQDSMQSKAVGGLSYNQLVEKMLLSKDAEGDAVVEGIVIEEFLARTASQLTYHGLCELNLAIQEEELCVFFRNNHFSTLYKHKGELFLLVTDQGFLNEPAVVWETLLNIDGDGEFVNSNFVSVRIQNDREPDPNAPAEMSQEDRDYLIALSLHQDVETGSSSNDSISQRVHTVDSDHELAKKMQEDYDRQVQQQEQQQRQQQQRQQMTQGSNAGPSPQTAEGNTVASQHPRHQQSISSHQRTHQDRDKSCTIL